MVRHGSASREALPLPAAPVAKRLWRSALGAPEAHEAQARRDWTGKLFI